MTTMYALAVGLAVGFLFGFTKLPVPAPPTLAGVLGIAGITLGWQLGTWVMGRF